jgi:hypothetical protein
LCLVLWKRFGSRHQSAVVECPFRRLPSPPGDVDFHHRPYCRRVAYRKLYAPRMECLSQRAGAAAANDARSLLRSFTRLPRRRAWRSRPCFVGGTARRRPRAERSTSAFCPTWRRTGSHIATGSSPHCFGASPTLLALTDEGDRIICRCPSLADIVAKVENCPVIFFSQ